MQQRWMWIVWPAFMVAGVLEVLVFGLLDPQELSWMGHTLEWPRQAVYTAGFFVFWAFAAASSALTTMLARSPFEVNRCPLDGPSRPDGCPKQDVRPTA